MKKFFIIPVLVLVVASAVLIACNFGGTTNALVANAHGFLHLEEKPDDGQTLNVVLADDEESQIALAVALYTAGNESCKNAAYMTAYCNCLNTMNVLDDDNLIDLDIVMMKTQDEYFRIDYRLENDLPMFRTLSTFKSALNNSLDIILAERSYASAADETLTYEKVRNASIDENGVPYADWSGDYTTEQRALPVFNSNQAETHYFVNHTVTEDTIKSATVEWNEDGYYTVSIVLDVENPDATTTTSAEIRKGSGDTNASYSEVRLGFTIWENGYFRTFDVYEKWSATAIKIFEFKTTQEYSWGFSYDAADCDIENYADCKAMLAD